MYKTSWRGNKEGYRRGAVGKTQAEGPVQEMWGGGAEEQAPPTRAAPTPCCVAGTPTQSARREERVNEIRN